MNKEQLEALIREDPADAGRWLVYADWLQGHGDPRGELIALQHEILHARGDSARRAELKRRETALRETHARQLLGSLAGEHTLADLLQIEWRYGFARHVIVASHLDHDISGQDVLSAFLSLDSARFLEVLRVGALDVVYDYDYADAVEVLAETGPHESLLELHLTRDDAWDHRNTPTCSTLEGLAEAAPNLKVLTVRCQNLDIASVAVPSLSSLTWITGQLGEAAVKAVSEAPWPALKQLVLYLGTRLGDQDDAARFAPLLDPETLPELEHLGLCNAELANDLVDLLADSPLLPQLRTVDLSRGVLGEDGARRLLERQAAFGHLDGLVLDENAIDGRNQLLLRDAFGSRLSMRAQKDPQYPYISVAL